MSEFSAKLEEARKKLPFKELLTQHGSFCPWCQQQSGYIVERKEQHGRIALECVERIKSATDLVALVEFYAVKLTKSGASFTGLCPFHSEKSPSFNVVPAKAMFHCFGCQASGSAIEFVRKKEGCDFRKACEFLARRAGIPLVFEHERYRQFFACQTANCPSKSEERADALDEINYLAKSLNLRPAEAGMAYFKMAGVFKDQQASPSVLPGTRGRKIAPPKMDEENPPAPPPPAPAPLPAPPSGESEATETSLSSGAGGPGPSSGPAPTVGSTPTGAATPNKPPPAEKCTGKPGGKECGKPAGWQHPNFPEAAFCEDCKAKGMDIFPNNWAAIERKTEPVVIVIGNNDELEGMRTALKKIRTQIGARKAFAKADPESIRRLEENAKRTEEAIAKYEAEKKASAALARKKERKTAHELGLGFAALLWFYEQLTLSESDERELWIKRGLCSKTTTALGYRSNPEANRQILIAMRDLFDWAELRASGLWKPEDVRGKKDRRPNSQFCGVGRIRKLGDTETIAPEDLRKNRQWVDKDNFLWGYCHPILIPYFDELGRLISLRPHKGMGQGGTVVGTPHLYVPRPIRPPPKEDERPKPIAEKYPVAVIGEGEFKAAAVWQTLGGGSGLSDPVGACCIPGINFAKNFEVREELDEWLRTVLCHTVKVGFDHEDKSDKPLRKRHDAQIWARYLAGDLAEKLHVRGEVCVLPDAWQTNKKADWDGGLAKVIHEQKET